MLGSSRVMRNHSLNRSHCGMLVFRRHKPAAQGRMAQTIDVMALLVLYHCASPFQTAVLLAMAIALFGTAVLTKPLLSLVLSASRGASSPGHRMVAGISAAGPGRWQFVAPHLVEASA